IIVRVQAVGRFNRTEFPQPGWGFADDSIQLLSEATYREFMLPCHRRRSLLKNKKSAAQTDRCACSGPQ
ncbi:MAG: hypothetical protein MUO63_02545, partial [Desulfobulbaceae bacterium]|nr:hypothetical protein [Desulfobulbaceae bacterium]